MDTTIWAVIVTAVSSCILGLGIMFPWLLRRGARSRPQLVIGLMIFTLGPVFFIFSFFPDSSVNGEFTWGQAGGAIAAYIVVWLLAVRRVTQAAGIDDREAAVEKRAQDLAAADPPAGGRGAVDPLNSGDVEMFELARAAKCRIGLVPGKIEEVRFADIWASSENTNMQMARYYDRSVSGVIRYLGGRRNAVGEVTADTVAAELAEHRGHHHAVAPGTVFDTSAGELTTTHNVKRILHVAAVAGEYGYGYRPVSNLAACVANALQCAQRLAEQRPDIESVLLPLFGAGTGGGPLPEIAHSVIQAAIDHLEAHQSGRIKVVYILAFIAAEQAACRAVLHSDDRILAAQPVPRYQLRAARARS